MIRLFWLTVLIVALAEKPAYSQDGRKILVGRVVDAITNEPLPGVSIFFANTTIGTTSQTDGSFQIKDIPVGKYDVVASFIGYQSFLQATDFTIQANGMDKEVKLHIALEPEVRELKEIIVNADTANRARNFLDFKRLFLGETRNAKTCTILNPHDIHIYFDAKDAVLVAHAKKPIEIENHALGYKIYYYLHQFEVNYKTNTTYVFGIPRFEELPLKKTREYKSRERERIRAYNGSVLHFMRSLRDSSLQQNSFTMKKVYTVPNRKRPSDEFLDKKIASLKTKNKNGSMIISINPKDSLPYYLRLKSAPKEIDSIAPFIYSGKEFFSRSKNEVEGIKGKYEIGYDEQEEIEYLTYAGRKYTEKQKSKIHFHHNQLKIYQNGYYEDVRSIFLEGYFSWHEKISTLLPIEYVPNAKR